MKETTMLKLLYKLGWLVVSNHMIEVKQLIEGQIKKEKKLQIKTVIQSKIKRKCEKWITKK